MGERLALMAEKDLNELATDLQKDKAVELKNSKGKPREFIYWEKRKEVEQRVKEGEDIPKLFKELKRVSPAWLDHVYIKKSKSVQHRIDYDKFLKQIETIIDVVVTDKNPNGYHYTGKYWQTYSKSNQITQAIKNEAIYELSSWKIYDKTNTGDLNKLYAYLYAYMLQAKEIKFDKAELVNFESGTLDLNTLKEHSFNKDDYITSALPVNVSFNDDNGGLVAEYARHLLGDEEKTLSEWFGYMFFKDASDINAIVFMQGVGGNGKSTLLKTLLSAFGDFGSSISFSQLSGKESDRFVNQLSTSYANILTESDTEINSNGMTLIKKISSGDPITANPKGKDTFTYTPRAKFLISVNYRLPVFEDSKEYQRRLVLLFADAQPIESMADNVKQLFLTKFDKKKLKEALPEYIGYAIKLAKQAIAKKQLTLLPATRTRISDWLKSEDYISQFIEEYLVNIIGKNGASVKYVYDQFKPFMNEQGFDQIDIISFRQFRNALLSKGLEIATYPTKGMEKDKGVVDDPDVNKKSRLKGKGVNEHK
jgi:putative DNA primase/helicase